MVRNDKVVSGSDMVISNSEVGDEVSTCTGSRTCDGRVNDEWQLANGKP
jgi:hypothetical protein